MRHLKNLWLIATLFVVHTAKSQLNGCLPNIGFETGSLNDWMCSTGSIARDGSLNLNFSGPAADRHTIIQNTYPQLTDPYGGFPVNCPNGSGYSVRLGNSLAGGQAESMAYSFTIPANKNDFSILYNYAVVFQNPNHQPHEQPRFTSRIFNVTDNQYIDCGSFEFQASRNLPGFELSPGSTNVYFKPWAPVTVNLIGLAGKTVRLEFFTNDCAFTQHFGYAYIDVNEDCFSSPVSGGTYCGTPNAITLTAPFGFATYSWYNSTFTQHLGSENILTISPAPPSNTEYAVVITPYEGIGCLDTMYTTINISNEPFQLNVKDEIIGCASTGVDLTSPTVTAGSTQGLTFTYYTDLNQTNYVPVPSIVTTSGLYYIKGINKEGCNDIKPIRVTILQPPDLRVTNPPGVCKPLRIDISSPGVTTGSEAGLALSYWKDKDATIPLANPSEVDIAGVYYIMASKPGTCNIIKPVQVLIGDIPNIQLHNPTACGKVDITDTSVTSGSTPGLSFSYWTDPATTIGLNNVNAITTSGVYYILSSSINGCSVSKPILVTINPIPNFIVTDPAPVNYPVQTVDITTAVDQNNGLNYTYWLDSLTRKPVSNPRGINKRGRFFIRGTNEYGCSIIKPVNVVILPPPDPIVYVPNAFTPNNDGRNDVFKITIIGETSVHYLRVFNRWGQLVYDNPNMNTQWNGKFNNIELPTGVYVWVLGGLDTYLKKPFSKKGIVTLIR